VTYTFKVTNTGDVTLHGIAISDTAFSGSGHMAAVQGGAATLAPGAAATFTATYRVTAADLRAGKITNTALAAGKDPAGVTTRSNSSSAVVAVVPVIPVIIPAGQGRTAGQLIGDDMLIAGLALAPFAAAAGAMTLIRRRRGA
jgi:hypothetical protein